MWSELHFSGSASIPIQLILVERLNPRLSQSQSKPMWLVWIGQSMLSLSEIWRKYLRRFAVDHWYRFLKQRLHWTIPQLSTPQQCERWSDLMPIMTWELWLARDLVAQHHLPWQKPIANLTPGRVAQSISLLLPEIGTPAVAPKPRGKSSGWTEGNKRTKRTRYPVVKKGKARYKKRSKNASFTLIF